MAYNRPSELTPTGKHTPGHLDCPACARANQMLYQALSGDLLFAAAFERWISHRVIESNGQRAEASYIARKTERDYRVCAKALEKFFARLKLEEIHVGHLMEYQRARALNPHDDAGEWRAVLGNVVKGPFAARELAEATAENLGPLARVRQTLWARPAGANCIRKEIALVIRMLRGAKLWGDQEEESFLRLRPEESDVERALSIEEQHRLLHVAGSRAEWRMIYQYAIVALQTTAGTNELRALRLGDVFLGPRPYIQVPKNGAKNKYRMRTIPLVTRDAVWAMEGLVERAGTLGASSPADYLFPLQIARTHYDPSRPMSESGLKKPWDALRRAAGLPQLRLYDLRHTGITRMAERGVPLPVAMSFAGHMTRRMQEHYIAVSMSAQRGWGETVWGDVPRPAELAAKKPPAREVGTGALEQLGRA